MYSVKHIIIHLNEYDIMSAREPESCLQISAERRMMITKAAASSKATNRDIIKYNTVILLLAISYQLIDFLFLFIVFLMYF
jgi:hypothetical protein